MKIFFFEGIEEKYDLGNHIINFPQNKIYIEKFKEKLEKKYSRKISYTCFGDPFTIIFF